MQDLQSLQKLYDADIMVDASAVVAASKLISSMLSNQEELVTANESYRRQVLQETQQLKLAFDAESNKLQEQINSPTPKKRSTRKRGSAVFMTPV